MVARAPRIWLVIAAALALLFAGCGGDDEDGDSTSTKAAPAGDSAPKPKEPLRAAAERLERAVATGGCERLADVMIHSVTRGPDVAADAAPTKRECRYVSGEVRNVLEGLHVTKVQEFGPAGVSEATGERTGSKRPNDDIVATIWILDLDGSWKAVFSSAYRPQIGVQPATPNFAKNAREFVAAAAGRNCNEFWRLMHVGSRFVRGNDGKRARFCKGLPASYKVGGLADLAKDPTVRPEELGVVRDIGLYGVALDSGRYMVVALTGLIGGIADDEIKQHANPSVIEVISARSPRG